MDPGIYSVLVLFLLIAALTTITSGVAVPTVPWLADPWFYGMDQSVRSTMTMTDSRSIRWLPLDSYLGNSLVNCLTTRRAKLPDPEMTDQKSAPILPMTGSYDIQ